MPRRTPRLEYLLEELFATADGLELPCVRVPVGVLADLEDVTAPYRDGYHVAVVFDSLEEPDRPIASLLLEKVARTDKGHMIAVRDGLALLIHPGSPPSAGDGPGGVREPRHPRPPAGVDALEAELPGDH